MRLFKGIFLVAVCSLGMPAAWAVPDRAVEVAANNLDETLATLKQSVGVLSETNRTLAAKNTELRIRVKSLNTDFKAAQAEAARLAAQFNELGEKYEKKQAGVRAVQESLAHSMEELVAVNKAQESLAGQLKAKDTEAQGLTVRAKELAAEIAALKSGQAVSSDVVRQRLNELSQEKERAQQGLTASTAAMKATRDEWQTMNAVINNGPKQLEPLKKEQETIKGQIGMAQGEIDGIKKAAADESALMAQYSDQEKYSPAHLEALERETSALQHGVADLDALVQKMRADAEAKAVDRLSRAEIERKKTEVALKEIAGRNKVLRADFEKLRKDMVVLDKKRTALEKEIYTPSY
ncbi:MAG: hypothetical protein HQL19_07730 [Candidatus Omnitrophica bacterium]|nr:hypothetical protein [Candidatus Omnitrophota bacterium]